MKLGLYGGSFDPIHIGHTTIAKAVKQKLGLDQVHFVVASTPPHKLDKQSASGEVRLEMVRLALEGEKGLVASDIEIKRGGISYTIDLLTEYKKLFPDAELYFIVGADMLINFPLWRSPKDIARLAKLVAVKRPGYGNGLLGVAEKIRGEFGATVITPDITGQDISSRQIRQHIYDAKPVNQLVPYAAELYMYEHALYMPEEIKEIKARIATIINNMRLRHTMYTVREAVMLAHTYGVDTKKARLAAILHDCMKLPNKTLIEYDGKNGFNFTYDEITNPYLIHARLGAWVAEHEFGVKDAQVLQAIANHTVGSTDMSMLDKIIYLADKIEPSRQHRRIDSLRQTAYTDIDKGVITVMRHTISFTESTGRKVNSTTIAAINSLLTQSKTIKTGRNNK